MEADADTVQYGAVPPIFKNDIGAVKKLRFLNNP